MDDEVENVLDLEEMSQEISRGELEYGESWKRKLLNTRKIENTDVLYVECPIHPWHLMTPVKIGVSRYAERVTLQCHGIDQYQKMCLIIVEVLKPLEGSHSYIKPGDILNHESWRDVIEEVQKINRETRVKGPQVGVEEMAIPFKPPNPWDKKGTMIYIVWETFWSKIMEKGECSIEDINQAWTARRGEKQLQRLHTITVGTSPIASWMRKRTGYVVKLYGDVWRVVGRSEGEEDRFPWSSEQYRESFYSQGSLSHSLTNEQDEDEESEGEEGEDSDDT